MTRRFVSIGECMVEMAPQEGGLYAMGFAGDTFNTAWYARRCLPEGWSVDYLSALGTDAISDRMADFMTGAGIGTAYLRRLPGQTVGLYLISLTGAERSFSYWRSTSAARALAADPGHLDAALAGADLAYLSGITLAILTPEDRARLLAALARARAAGARIAFDPNLRPALWPSAQAMCGAVMQAAGQADLVLPSFDDEARFFGDADAEATARRYLTAGAATGVVKDGPGEILLATPGGQVRCQPPAVASVVDTTAAGDSFNAGFLAAHLLGRGDQAALAAGATLAGQVIGARGALVSVTPCF